MTSVKTKRLESLKKRGNFPISKKKIGRVRRQEGEKLKKEIQLLRENLACKEAELNQLKEQLRYKNQQLASKDLEFESYKKISEEKIILLEAKIKELESKLKKSTSSKE